MLKFKDTGLRVAPPIQMQHASDSASCATVGARAGAVTARKPASLLALRAQLGSATPAQQATPRRPPPRNNDAPPLQQPVARAESLTQGPNSVARCARRETQHATDGDDGLPRACWRMYYSDRGWREVCFAPTVSRAEALLLHGDATDAVPGWD